MNKVILHIDLNNFFASVECILNPSLKEHPIAVCGDPKKRSGIVLAKNELAKACGVKTCDLIHEAREKCKGIIFVPPHYQEYSKYSKLVKNICLEYSDYMESFGIDECWLDVTNSQKLFGNGLEIAKKIQKEIFNKTGLTVSIGVSFTKTFAKIGSDYKKPNAITVISKENFKDIVWKLDANALLFIGDTTYEKLKKLNISNIGDLAKADKKLIEYHLGLKGSSLIDIANGIENSEVRHYLDKRQPKSVSHGTTLIKDTKDIDTISSVICFLSDMIERRLINNDLYCSGVSLTIKNSKLTSKTKQVSLSNPTCSGYTIKEKAIEILKEFQPFSLPIRMISVGTYKITDKPDLQLNMFENKDNNKLSLTLNKIKDKYGVSSIQRLSYLDNNILKLTDKNTLTEDEDLLPFKHD